MKNRRLLISTFLVTLLFMACGPSLVLPNPVKVHLSGVTFTRMSDCWSTGIYQLDGQGNYYTDEDIVVDYFMDCVTISDGSAYLVNDKYLDPLATVESRPDTFFRNPDSDISLWPYKTLSSTVQWSRQTVAASSNSYHGTANAGEVVKFNDSADLYTLYTGP